MFSRRTFFPLPLAAALTFTALYAQDADVATPAPPAAEAPKPPAAEAPKPAPAEAPKPVAPETPKPPAAKPASPDPSEAQLEKLATESEKEASAEETKKDAKKTGKKGTEKNSSVEPEKAEKSDKEEPVVAKKTKKEKEKEKEKEPFRPDFRDQEIQDILKIFSKIIGKNIIADEKVKGKITVISPYKIPRSLAYPYLYSMLAIKGFGIVEENDNLIRVVAIKDALAGSPLIYLGREEIKDPALKSDLAVTQILPVYGSKPSRLSAILKRLTSANTDLVDYDDINMLIISGSQFEVNRLIRIANLIDYKGTGPVTDECEKDKDAEGCTRGDVHVYRLENMLAENIETTLKKVQLPVEPLPAAPSASGTPAPAVSQGNIQRKPIDVVGHKETNSIIFVGTDEEFKLVKSLIKRIDLQRQQVFLEVLIVEVGIDRSNFFGIDWIAGKGVPAQFNTGLAAPFINTTTGQIDPNRVNTNQGFSMTILNDSIASVIGILNAKIGKTNFVVVSAPQVLTLDNQEAEINVGEDRPVRVNSITTAVGTLNQSQSFEYRPTGVKLKFTPQVNKNRMVTLNIFQEIKGLDSTDAASGNPIISKKDIKTYVRVQDGQTIVIGGLVSSNNKRILNKVPILGELPLIGFIFRRSDVSQKRTNLMVFITPHILTNRAIADKVTNDLKQDQQNETKRNSLD